MQASPGKTSTPTNVIKETINNEDQVKTVLEPKTKESKKVTTEAGPNRYLRIIAVSRMMLDNIKHIQASWFSEGKKTGQIALRFGADDFGGTLINESISTSAGSQHGQLMKPSSFRDMIRDCGRTPAERYTTYEVRKIFDSEDQERAPLDYVGEDVEEIFGSYNKLIGLEEFRFDHPRKIESVKE